MHIDGEVVDAAPGPGLLVLLGCTHSDGHADVAWTARKIAGLRILAGEQSATDLGAPVLLVSQFTLYGDARKGRRPTWEAAAPGTVAEPLYDAVAQTLRDRGVVVPTGRFGADMRINVELDGPVTVLLESPG